MAVTSFASGGLGVLTVWIGTLFIHSGTMKLAGTEDLELAVRGYRLVPPRLVRLVSLILPWIEIATGVFVICGVATGILSGIILGLCFAAGGISVLRRGFRTPCGCAGTSNGDAVSAVTVARAMSIVIVCSVLWAFREEAPPIPLVVIVAGGATSIVPSLWTLRSRLQRRAERQQADKLMEHQIEAAVQALASGTSPN